MNSALYECHVMHHRLAPKVHRFQYEVFYLWLDLDEIDALSEQLRFFKRNRWSLFSFFDADHIVKDGRDVKENVLQILREHGQSRKYYHSMVGWDCRMDGIQGAALRVKLRHLARWNTQRRAHARRYSELLADIPGLREATFGASDSGQSRYLTFQTGAGRFLQESQEIDGGSSSSRRGFLSGERGETKCRGCDHHELRHAP